MVARAQDHLDCLSRASLLPEMGKFACELLPRTFPSRLRSAHHRFSSYRMPQSVSPNQNRPYSRINQSSSANCQIFATRVKLQGGLEQKEYFVAGRRYATKMPRIGRRLFLKLRGFSSESEIRIAFLGKTPPIVKGQRGPQR